MQLVKESKSNDHQTGRTLGEWATDSDFYKKSLFSDEAHFFLNGSLCAVLCEQWFIFLQNETGYNVPELKDVDMDDLRFQ